MVQKSVWSKEMLRVALLALIEFPPRRQHALLSPPVLLHFQLHLISERTLVLDANLGMISRINLCPEYLTD